MKSVIDDRLRQEQREYRLRFACADCAHFDPDQRRCSNGFPSEAHQPSELGDRAVLTFCKAFELY